MRKRENKRHFAILQTSFFIRTITVGQGLTYTLSHAIVLNTAKPKQIYPVRSYAPRRLIANQTCPSHS